MRAAKIAGPRLGAIVPAAVGALAFAAAVTGQAALAGLAHAQDRAPAGSGAAAPASAKRPHEQVPIPPLRSFTTPKPLRIELAGGPPGSPHAGAGAVIFLLEDKELPLIDLSITFRGGSALETRAQAGLADLACEVLRTGGTAALPGDRLDEELEAEAVSIEVGASLTETTAALHCLTQSFDRWLPVFFELLTQPAFPEDKLELARKQHLSALARRNDDPDGIARRESVRALFGDATPFGWSEEPDTVKGVKREDLLAFHKRVFALDGAVVAIVGDFDAKAMQGKIVGALTKLGRRAEPLPALPAVEEGAAPRAVVVDRPELNQSTIVLGHLGDRRRADDGDYFAAVVANAILGGGGFSSRLLQKVRTELGLAYSVYSAYDAPYTHRGSFYVVCGTKCESTFQAIAAIKKELGRICSEEVSPEELAVAKESILQQLIFASESRQDIVERAVRYELYGFPEDYLERFQKGIAAVSAADVLRVAKARFHPDRLVTTIVGKRALFDGDPAAPEHGLGPVTALDVDEPAYRAPKPADSEGGAAGAIVAPTPEERRALVAKAIEAMGGQFALSRVTGLKLTGSGTFATPQGPMPVKVTSLVVYPDKARSELLLPFGKIVQCYDGSAGWVEGPMGLQDLPPSDAAELRKQAEEDEIRLLSELAKRDDPGVARLVKLGAREVIALECTAPKAILYLDPASGRLVGRDAGEDAYSLYDDFREVLVKAPLVVLEGKGGLPPGAAVGTLHKVILPFSVKRFGVDGAEQFSLQLDEIQANPTVSADAFTKPAPKGSTPKPGEGGQ